MAASRKDRRLRQIGREHLRSCVKLVARTPELKQATAEALQLLAPADIHRANSSAENAASLLYAIVEAVLSDSPVGEAESYVFHASIFTAAFLVDQDGPLVTMAGESAASNLAAMLIMALKAEKYDFILAGAADILDRFGDLLGQAYYNAEATGFRLASIESMHRTRKSAMANLDIETELEMYRVQLRRLLPIARRECATDDTRSRMLDIFENMLDVLEDMP